MGIRKVAAPDREQRLASEALRNMRDELAANAYVVQRLR